MPELLVRFRGPVSCRCAAQPPALTLSGNSAEPSGEGAVLALSAAAPAECPAAALEDAVVERLGDGQYRITSAARSWLIRAAAAHLHFEIGAQFYRAIPPRRAPWWKRVLWRIVLVMAASRAGLATLRALRR
jgi:hypothetical protein